MEIKKEPCPGVRSLTRRRLFERCEGFGGQAVAALCRPSDRFFVFFASFVVPLSLSHSHTGRPVCIPLAHARGSNVFIPSSWFLPGPKITVPIVRFEGL